MRRSVHLLSLALASVLAALVLTTPAQAAGPYCGVTWGSQARTAGALPGTGTVTDVRAGRHPCFDRLVVDVGGQDAASTSYRVRYVTEVTADASGAVVPLRGGAHLQITVGAPAYGPDGEATTGTGSELADVSGYRTFRQVAYAGSFEGQTDIGLGVRARLPFRVFVLAGTPDTDHTSRLVVDVAHRW